MITRATWPDLPKAVRTAIRHRTGRIDEVTPIQAGLNSGLAAILYTCREPVFIKGMPADHPQAATQQREADINPYVVPVAPHLRWRITTAGWDILGFEHIDGRHADLAPVSPDLPKIADALAQLHTMPVTDVSLRRFEDRWADHLGSPADRACLSGNGLLHTDLNPGNILITENAARITDWAWPTHGASWIDPACLALWLIHAGHTPTPSRVLDPRPARVRRPRRGSARHVHRRERGPMDRDCRQRPKPVETGRRGGGAVLAARPDQTAEKRPAALQ